MKKTSKDLLTGIVTTLFGIALLVYLIPTWVVSLTISKYTNPNSFPIFISWVLILLGISLVISTLMKKRALKHSGQDMIEETKVTSKCKSAKEFFNGESYSAIVTVLTVILYEFLLSRIGFIATGCICSVLLLVAFKSKKWYHYVIVIAFTFVLNFVFGTILNVNVP